MQSLIRLVAVFCCSVGMSYGASFDCQKASTTVEKLVCGNSHLSDLDTKLNNAYRAHIAESPREAQMTKAAQHSWITTVRNQCTDEPCSDKAYSARVKELISIVAPSSTGEYVVDPKEFAEIERQFRESLAGEGISMKNCSLMVRLDRPQNMPGHDDSYGAFCVSTTNRSMMVCDDTMVGKLTISFSYVGSAKWLLNFVRTNCAQGG